MVKQVKTGKNFYLLIYSKMQRGGDRAKPNRIKNELGLSKQNMSYYLRTLKATGLIQRNDPNNVYAGWRVEELVSDEEVLRRIEQVKQRGKNKSSLGKRVERPPTNLHALQINFPILSGVVKDSDWQIKHKLKNWLPKYKGLNNLGGLTIKNNNNKSITVFAKSRDIENLEDIDNLAFKIKTFIHEYFKTKHEVSLDVFNCQLRNLNIATEDKDSEGMLRKGEKFELNLNKTAEKVFENDNIPGKAWLDGSPFNFTAETNDKEWKRAYLRMPFNIQYLYQTLPALEEYNRNLKLHIEVMEDIRELVNELKNGNPYKK